MPLRRLRGYQHHYCANTHINGNVVLDPDQTCNAVTVDNAGGFGPCGGWLRRSADGHHEPISGHNDSAAIKPPWNAAFLSITPPAGGPAVGTLGGGTPLAAPLPWGDVGRERTGSRRQLVHSGVYTSITSILITDDISSTARATRRGLVFQSASSLTTADAPLVPGHTPYSPDQRHQGLQCLVAGRQFGDDWLLL